MRSKKVSLKLMFVLTSVVAAGLFTLSWWQVGKWPLQLPILAFSFASGVLIRVGVPLDTSPAIRVSVATGMGLLIGDLLRYFSIGILVNSGYLIGINHLYFFREGIVVELVALPLVYAVRHGVTVALGATIGVYLGSFLMHWCSRWFVSPIE